MNIQTKSSKLKQPKKTPRTSGAKPSKGQALMSKVNSDLLKIKKKNLK